MKKIFKLSTAAMLALSLAACSSDDVVDNGGNGKFTDGEGFIGVNILKPNSDAGTRANDELDDGETDEFAVTGAKIYLFTGSDEATATFYKAEDLTKDFETDEAKNITSTNTKVVKIDDMTKIPTGKIFAYVVVNPGKSGLATNPAKDQTFKDWSEKQFDATATVLGGSLQGKISEADGLLMTNSPVSATPGGPNAAEGPVYTAVEIHKENIMKTEEEAKNNPAACIYVERACAKVTVEDGTTKSNIEMNGDNVAFEIVGWQVFNVEPKFTNTRQANVEAWLPYFSQYHPTDAPNTKYRFVTRDYFVPTIPGDNHTLAYRTYFAQDLQYDKEATLDITKPVDATDSWLAPTTTTSKTRAFVPENTFDVAHQTWNNATQVALKVKFNEGKDFYTITNDAALYDSKDKVEAALTAKIQALFAVDKWSKDAAAEMATLKGKSITATVSATVKDSEVGKNNVGYEVSVTFSEGALTDLASATQTAWEKVKEDAEKAMEVALYKGGMSYYNVRIKHFGEFETPWAPTYADASVEDHNKTEYIYNQNNAADFLGRYGVVRDNWYKLTVSSIAKLGDAEPKDVKGDPTPDDQVEEDQYISVHVHIIPWVLRTQDVIL